MARTRNVGLDNAEKITRRMARMLGLSESEPLELKAEIMDYPGTSASLLWVVKERHEVAGRA